MCRSSRNALTWLVTKTNSLWKPQKYRWRFVSLQSSSVWQRNRITMDAIVFPPLLEEQLHQLSWCAKPAQWVQGNQFLGVQGSHWRTNLCLWTAILAGLPHMQKPKVVLGWQHLGSNEGQGCFYAHLYGVPVIIWDGALGQSKCWVAKEFLFTHCSHLAMSFLLLYFLLFPPPHLWSLTS